jgi:two-component system, chemotaxis family, chemotaxis protein CheY
MFQAEQRRIQAVATLFESCVCTRYCAGFGRREGRSMKRSVMIVDDVADIRLMLRCMIEKENYVIVAEAANGVEAVEQYREHLPDITIMDLDMPYKTGVQAAREILAHSSNARIIFCSGGVRSYEIMNLELGANARNLIPKPFSPTQLYQALSLKF